jgi:hypothetical protein
VSRPRTFLLAAATLASTLIVPAQVFAKPPHKAAIVRHYGDLLPKRFQSCDTCHLSDDEVSKLKENERNPAEKKPWNAFGRTLSELGKKQAASNGGANKPSPILDRLLMLADQDADGDSVVNELELIAGTSPGKADDRPSDAQLAAAKKQLDAFRSARTALAWNPFQPVARPEVPLIQSEWTRNPIDAFIAQEHNRLGLKPRPPAPKEVLLRRVYLDLIGLPPTRDELRAFLNDSSADAYQRVVDRLLASPRYGERWGRHWMDIWRYSDWAGWGQQVRDSQKHIWRWRDWIIESLNADKSYDQMVLEMLAADEIMPGDRDALRATGFLVRNFKLLSREQWLTETVDHTSRAFLGVTLKCAQCHDHRYDLLTHEEYYRFRAIFEPYQVRTDPLPGQLNPEEGGVVRAFDSQLDAQTFVYINGDERTPDKSKPMTPAVPAFLGGGDLKHEPVSLAVESYYPSLAPFVIDEMVAKARLKVEAAKAAVVKLENVGSATASTDKESALAKANLAAAEAELQSLESRIAAERAKYSDGKPDDELKPLAQTASKAERASALATAEAALLTAEHQVAQSRKAAETDEKAKKVLAEAEKKLEEAKKARETAQTATQTESDKYSPLGPVHPRTSTGRRLALARWIASPQNPLTARVAVNHIWARHFGAGLLPSVDEFGQNRTEPSHSALLDWLAAELMSPSVESDPHVTPANGWSMKHIHRLIVTSNTYRTASTNDPNCYAVDPDNKYLWRTTARRAEAEVIRDSVLFVSGGLDLTTSGPDLDHNQGLTSPRRSLYFRSAPEKQMLFLQIFDMAAPTECYERRESVVPQQALALANSELTVRESRRLARRLIDQSSANAATFITTAFEHILSRSPTADEVHACATFLDEQTHRFQSAATSFGETTSDSNELMKPSAEPSLRARENLIHVLYNHHEFVTVR